MFVNTSGIKKHHLDNCYLSTRLFLFITVKMRFQILAEFIYTGEKQ